MNRDLLAAELDRHRDELARFVGRHAGIALRHETAEDLVQGVHVRALDRADSFTWRTREEFRAWCTQLARSHLADRCEYWLAAKRRPARLLRLTHSDHTGARGLAPPASARAGPATAAERNEDMARATEALALLLPRDADLVQGLCDGRTVDEDSERLGISYAAAQRARLRALDRYRKSFRLLESGRRRRGR